LAAGVAGVVGAVFLAIVDSLSREKMVENANPPEPKRVVRFPQGQCPSRIVRA
jgi:hypothetical protein